jgi:F420-0:gamma-glutamyl ligase
VVDIINKKDFSVKPFLITRRTTADNLVSAAQGEADESTPAVIIRDAPAVFSDGSADTRRFRGRSVFILHVLISRWGLNTREMRAYP